MNDTLHIRRWFSLGFLLIGMLVAVACGGWYAHLIMSEHAIEKFFKDSEGAGGGVISGEPKLNWNADILTVRNLKIVSGNSEIFGDVEVKGLRALEQSKDKERRLALVFTSKGVKMDGVLLEPQWVMNLVLSQVGDHSDITLDLGLMDSGPNQSQALISVALKLADAPDFIGAVKTGLGEKGSIVSLNPEFIESALMIRPELVRVDVSDDGFLRERWSDQLLMAHQNMNQAAVDKVIEAQFVEFERYVKDKALSQKLRALVLEGRPFHMVATQESPVTVYDLYLIFIGKMLIDPGKGVYKVAVGD